MKKLIIALSLSALVLVACGGDAKPSKKAVQDKFKEVILAQPGVKDLDGADDRAEAFAKCVTDKVYDDTSAKTLKKFVDAKSTSAAEDVKGTDKEADRLEKAGTDCADKLSE